MKMTRDCAGSTTDFLGPLGFACSGKYIEASVRIDQGFILLYGGALCEGYYVDLLYF